MRKIVILCLLILAPSLAYAETYGPNFFEGKPCVASSETAPTYSCDKANDANDSTFWQSVASSMPDTWQIDNATSGEWLNKVSIKTQDGPYIKDFDVQGTDATSTWTTLGTFQHGNNSSYEDFIFTASVVPYRYYRIRITSSWYNYGYDQSAIDEIQGFQCTDCVSTSTIGTTTLTAADAVLWQLYLMLDALWFIGVFAAAIGIISYVFYIRKKMKTE